MNRAYTDFLGASGSFLLGAGSLLNIEGSYFQFNRSGTPEQADARAIHQDFAMIGQDIRDVLVEPRGSQMMLDLDT